MVEVNITTTPVQVSITQGVTQLNAMTYTPLTGASFSGTSGDSGRYYVHTASISANAIIGIGGRFAFPGDFSLSTSVLTNDKITIPFPLDDSDVVQLWN